MFVIEWDDSLSIGIYKIDNHNKHVLNLSNALHQKLNMLSDVGIANMLVELLEFYTFYIACEEIWMSHSKYDLIKEHEKDHARIKQILSDITTNFKNDKTSPPTSIIYFTQQLIEHIKQHDVEYANFVHDKRSSLKPT